MPRLIDYERLVRLLNFTGYDEFSKAYRRWIEVFLKKEQSARVNRWTQSIATGSQGFVEHVKQKLGSIARGRQVVNAGGTNHELKEALSLYGDRPGRRIGDNTIRWEVLPSIPKRLDSRKTYGLDFR